MLGLIGLELLGAVLGGVVFITLYGLWAPWSDSSMGRHIMALAVAMAGKDMTLLLLAAGVRIPIWVFAVGYGVLNWVIWWRVWLLFKVQRWEGNGGMAAWVYTSLRTGAQAIWGLLVGQLAGLGVTLPDWMQGWFVETLFVAGGIAAVTAAIRWLETRKGDSLGSRVARWVARVAMLGLSKQPVYAAPIEGATPATVIYDNSQTRKALKE